jgi:hypothetical protein
MTRDHLADRYGWREQGQRQTSNMRADPLAIMPDSVISSHRAIEFHQSAGLPP